MPEPGSKRGRGAAAAARGGKAFRLPATVSRPELLVGDSDHAFRQLIYELSYVTTLVNTARRNLAAMLNLTPPQYNIVMVVAEYMGEHGISVIEVAKHLFVSGAFVTAETRKMESRDFFERASSPADGRLTLLSLSAHAEAELRRIAPEIRRFNDTFFGELSKSDFTKLMGVQKALIRGAEAALVEFSSAEQIILPLMRRKATRSAS